MPITTTSTFPAEVDAPASYRRSPADGDEAATLPVASAPKAVWLGTDIALVALVAVLAFVAAITAVGQYRHAAARNRLADEMVTAAAAFSSYLRDQGALPPPANAGELPAGTQAYLTSVKWTAPTPVGGLYRWVNYSPLEPAPGAALSGAVEVTAFGPGVELKLTPADLLAIDRRIDDGDLTKGNFRAGFNGWPVLRVQGTP